MVVDRGALLGGPRYPPIVKTAARWLVIVLTCLAAAIGLLYAVVPPNETAEEGAADPVLAIRRPLSLP